MELADSFLNKSLLEERKKRLGETAAAAAALPDANASPPTPDFEARRKVADRAVPAMATAGTFASLLAPSPVPANATSTGAAAEPAAGAAATAPTASASATTVHAVHVAPPPLLLPPPAQLATVHQETTTDSPRLVDDGVRQAGGGEPAAKRQRKATAPYSPLRCGCERVRAVG